MITLKIDNLATPLICVLRKSDVCVNVSNIIVLARKQFIFRRLYGADFRTRAHKRVKLEFPSMCETKKISEIDSLVTDTFFFFTLSGYRNLKSN